MRKKAPAGTVKSDRGMITVPAKTWKGPDGKVLHRLGELPAGATFLVNDKPCQVITRAHYIGGSVGCMSETGMVKFLYYKKVILCST